MALAVRLADLVASGLITAGAIAGYRDQTAEVTADGRLRSAKMDAVFDSPSSWATAVVRWQRDSKAACNGWATVRVNGELLDTYRQRYVAMQRGSATASSAHAASAASAASTALAPGPLQQSSLSSSVSASPATALARAPTSASGPSSRKRRSEDGAGRSGRRTSAAAKKGRKDAAGGAATRSAGSAGAAALSAAAAAAATIDPPPFAGVVMPHDYGAERDVCGMCGSFVRDAAKAVACAHCAEVYHSFCVEPAAQLAARESVGRGWRCMACLVCERCHIAYPDHELLVCDKCDRGYHMRCLRMVCFAHALTICLLPPGGPVWPGFARGVVCSHTAFSGGEDGRGPRRLDYASLD